MFKMPNTTIKILSGVDINSDYIHTLYFPTRAKQTEYFLSKAKYTLLNNYYVNKENRGEIQVELPMKDLLGCSYLMYKNDMHENKWFYAFITDVKYRNEDNTYIEFEIDEIQSWMFDAEITETFIERQHTNTDARGEHTVEEPLEVGNYIFKEITNTKTALNYGKMSLVINATFNKNFEDSMGQFNSADATDYLNSNSVNKGMFTGLSTIVIDDPTEAQQFFERVAEETRHDDIVSIYIVPSQFARQTDSYAPIDNKGSVIYENGFLPLSNIDGYNPKNNKMFINPYAKFVVSDGMGRIAEYNFEDFTGEEKTEGNSNPIAPMIPMFEIVGISSGKPEVRLIPLNYKGVARNLNEQFNFNNFPMVAYSTDAYKAWLAQNAVSFGAGVVGGVLGSASAIALGALTANPVAIGGGVVGLGTVMANSLQQFRNAKVQPDRTGGAQTSGSVNVYKGEFGYRFYSVTCRKDFAKKIDDYLTMFGYKINEVKKPKLKTRTYFTHIKTIGCNIIGKVPNKTMEKTRQIFDRGITFWDIAKVEEQGAKVGEYSKLDNRVVTNSPGPGFIYDVPQAGEPYMGA